MNTSERQGMVDFVVMGIVSQGGPSMGEGVDCAYRGADGRKCAAGLFIADEFYSSGLEGCGTNDPRVEKVLLQSGVPKIAMDFLSELQNAHDSSANHAENRESDDAFWEEFSAQIEYICESHKLQYPDHLM